VRAWLMARYEEENGRGPSAPAVRTGTALAPGPPGAADMAAKFRAARDAPVATAAELASISASVAGLPMLGDVVQVKAPGGNPA